MKITKLILSTSLFISSLFAADANKTMTNDEFMKQFMVLEQKEKDAKAKTIQVQKKLEETKKLRKTVDELGKQVGVEQ